MLQQMLLGIPSGGAVVDVTLEAQNYGRTANSPLLTDVGGTLSGQITANWGFSGYYSFVVPADATYEITCRGVNGRFVNVMSTATPEMLGAEIKANINVTAGWRLVFMAGQYGEITNDQEGAGGGGMSGVAYTTNNTNNASSVGQSLPLVIAGGGGGSCFNRSGYDHTVGDGNIPSTSHSGNMERGRAGDESGFPGSNCESHGWTIGEGGKASDASCGGNINIAAWNGGGFYSDGTGCSARSGGSHGQAFRNGCNGGNNQGTSGYGGFGGGGGGANNCGDGGGAGGYSGGGSGGYSGGCGGHGGGGGSFYLTTGSNSLVSATNYNTRYGYVRIKSI